MGSPLHGVVETNEGRGDVEDLLADPSPGVEDGVVGSTGNGVLSVGAEAVGDDTLLLEAA